MKRGLIMFASAVSIGAASYYVDATGGSDSSNGLTSGTAWQTLARATNEVYTSGDSILLKRGETWEERFVFKTTSTTLDAYGSGALPIIDGGGTIRTVISTGVVSNTVTQNIQIQNGGGGTGALWEGAIGTNTIQDCVLDTHASDACASASGDAHIIVRRCTISGAFDDGVTLHTTASALVESCRIFNCSQGVNNSGTEMEMTLNDCTFTNNTSDLGPFSECVAVLNRCRFDGRSDGAEWRFFDGGSNTTFNYCVFDGSRANEVSDPIFVANTGPVFVNNCVFYGGGFGNITVASPSVLTATNCIFFNWWQAAYIFDGAEFHADHCIFYGVTQKTNTTSTAEITSDPLFVSAAAGDFRLGNSSPALNSGIYINITYDLAGNIVSNPPEIGTYEYRTAVRSRRTLGLKGFGL